jgi:hypothetical protein
MLTGTHSSMQGPFPFHAREGVAMRPKEVGLTIGPSLEPSGAGGSTVAPKVLAEGSDPTAVPQELARMGGSVTVPQEPAGVGRSTVMPKVPREGTGSAVMPLDMREASPSAQEPGMGSKRSCPDEGEQRTRGSSPKHLHRPTAPM